MFIKLFIFSLYLFSLWLAGLCWWDFIRSLLRPHYPRIYFTCRTQSKRAFVIRGILCKCPRGIYIVRIFRSSGTLVRWLIEFILTDFWKEWLPRNLVLIMVFKRGMRHGIFINRHSCTGKTLVRERKKRHWQCYLAPKGDRIQFWYSGKHLSASPPPTPPRCKS